MAKNGNGNGSMNGNSVPKNGDGSLIRDFMKDLRIAQDAVAKAQEENRRLGIPNWYQINGEIVSDIELAARKGSKK